MGNYNSSRWSSSYRVRDTVEDCFCLSITSLSRRGINENYSFEGDYAGDWFGAVHRLNVGIYPDGAGSLAMDLNFITAEGKDPVGIDQRVQLHSLVVFEKYRRYYFECPLDKGKPDQEFQPQCLNRSSVLYLPPNKTKFGCRSCWDLSYRKNQSHDKRLDWIRENPNQMRDTMMKLMESEAIDPEHDAFVKKVLRSRFPLQRKPQTPGSGGSQSEFKK